MTKRGDLVNAVVCISENRGMLFGNRRQSRDKHLITDLINLVEKENGVLFVSDFSQNLFLDSEGCVIAVTDPLSSANEGDFAFVENRGLYDFRNKIEKLVIYKWNRDYPADFFLDIIPEAEGFVLVESLDFAGSSHKIITREIWSKEKQ